MNDFAAARGRAASGAILFFQEENLDVAERERPRDGKADHARADNHSLDFEHASASSRFPLKAREDRLRVKIQG
jgi:hypothetical protein